MEQDVVPRETSNTDDADEQAANSKANSVANSTVRGTAVSIIRSRGNLVLGVRFSLPSVVLSMVLLITRRTSEMASSIEMSSLYSCLSKLCAVPLFAPMATIRSPSNDGTSASAKVPFLEASGVVASSPKYHRYETSVPQITSFKKPSDPSRKHRFDAP